MNCDLVACSLNRPGAPHVRCTNEQHGNVPTVTRKSTQDLLDDYDNRIKCLQAGRANVQRTLDKFPVEVCPRELARLQRRDTQLALIEYEARNCILQPDPGVDIAGRFVLWLQQSSILRGQRF